MFAFKRTLPLVKRLWRRFIRPYRFYLLASVGCMVLSALATALFARFLQPIFDDIFMAHCQDKLWGIALCVLAIFMVKGMAAYGESLLMTFSGQKMIADLQLALFEHVIHGDLEFFHRKTSGNLIAAFTHDIQMLRASITQSLTNIGRDTLTLIFLLSLMFYQDWFLASLSFFIFPIAVIPLVRVGRRMRKVSTGTQEAMGGFFSFLQEAFQGIRLVKAYGMENYEKQKAFQKINALFQLHLKGARVRSAVHPLMETLGGVAIVLVILYGGQQVILGVKTTGVFISFISALLLAYEPVKKLVHMNANLQEGLAAAARIFSLLDTPAVIENKKQAQPIQITTGAVVFDNVTFAYPASDSHGPTKRKIFDGLSFSISGGKRVAFVGPSGAGKSTLFNLLLRFYEAHSGSILLDNQNIAHITLSSLRQQIAFVSQDITLFDDTIFANIRYGRPDADEKSIYKAAQGAAIHDFILSLPQGYETVVGEQGIKLSGGQRQRVAIARAFVKNAPLLLLDEATSALDTESEYAVQKALSTLMQGRTTLMIAHRLSTVKDADEIYVLDHGCVMESGTHEELLAKKGLYTRLVLPKLLGPTETAASPRDFQ